MGQGSFLHVCITNIGQKNLSTLQSKVHECTVQWQIGVGGEGAWTGGRMIQKVRGAGEGLGLRWARFFCLTKTESGQISFYPQCTDSKECFFLFFIFSTSFRLSSPWSVTVLSQRTVLFAAWQERFFVCVFFSLFIFPSSLSVQQILTRRCVPKGGNWDPRGHRRLVRELIGCSRCCRGNKKRSDQVCHVELFLLKLEGTHVPGMA